MKLIRNLYLKSRFFALIAGTVALFTISYPFPVLFVLAQGCLLILIAFTSLDIFLLFRNKEPLSAIRSHSQVLSLGDANQIKINLKNKYDFKTSIKIIDELPEQLQERNFEIKIPFGHYVTKEITYQITPKTRGIYTFGNINLFVSGIFRLAERRIVVTQSKDVPVYPSIIQMKNYELTTLSSISHFQGIKKLRRIGHSYEFEQIKQYTPGDDPRSINWKASGRAAQLMINQYDDERAQPVYCIIDKSRTMRMPFNNLSLLDYAINTSLVISNIVLRKHDKAGLLTFSNKLGSFIKAEKTGKQLSKILNHLYCEKVNWTEADYELLYSAASNFIRGRSLLFLFTNFESIYALERVLPMLRKLNKLHLLVVMFFENTELTAFCQDNCETLLEIYQQTAAKELISHKDQVQQILQMHGIQSIKCIPENLSISTINKYLELKARGYI